MTRFPCFYKKECKGHSLTYSVRIWLLSPNTQTHTHTFFSAQGWRGILYLRENYFVVLNKPARAFLVNFHFWGNLQSRSVLAACKSYPKSLSLIWATLADSVKLKGFINKWGKGLKLYISSYIHDNKGTLAKWFCHSLCLQIAVA